jgi:tRNA(Ile)-lysidine synthase
MPLPFHPERFLRAGDRVAAAVSGGADSVALLELLLEARERLGIVVSVAHFNHRLRGEESDADGQFVEKLAATKDVPFFGACAEARHDTNVEAQARQDRYRFFEQLVRQNCVAKVATAHTADDQAETVLARLLRGGGPAGLAGILPVVRDGVIFRPLLEVRRAELRVWAAARGLAWREDSSNLDRRFLRNRIRQDLLPQLERDYNPGIVNVLSHTAEVARAEEAHWQRDTEELASRMIRKTTDGPKLLLTDFVQLDEAQQRRLIRAAVALAKGDLRRLDFDHVERVRRLALNGRGNGRGIVEIPGGRVERKREQEVELGCEEAAHEEAADVLLFVFPP